MTHLLDSIFVALTIYFWWTGSGLLRKANAYRLQPSRQRWWSILPGDGYRRDFSGEGWDLRRRGQIRSVLALATMTCWAIIDMALR